MILNIFGLAVAAFIFVNALDRLRRVNWQTAKPGAVFTLLMQALWALFCLHAAIGAGLRLWQVASLVAILVWLHVTRPAWRNERVPGSVRSQHGALGPAELQRQKNN